MNPIQRDFWNTFQEVMESRKARGMYQDQAYTSLGYVGGLTPEERGILPNGRKKINQNPYQRGTSEYESWNNNYKIWKETRDFYFGASLDGKDFESSYWNKDIKGIFSDGDWQKKRFSEYSEKAQKEILAKRKLIAQYAQAHNLFSEEDWEAHEIKDDKIKDIWENNEDIASLKTDFYEMMTDMNKYHFDMLGVTDVDWQRQDDSIFNYNKPKAPLSRNPQEAIDSPIRLLEQPDPLDTYQREIVSPPPQPSNGTFTLGQGKEPYETKVESPYNTKKEDSLLSSSNLFGKGIGGEFAPVLDKKTEEHIETKKKKRQIQTEIDSQGLDNLISNSFKIDYDKEKNTFKYDLNNIKDYDTLKDSLRGITSQKLSQILEDYYATHIVSEEDKREIESDLKKEIGIEDKTFWDSIFGTSWGENIPQRALDLVKSLDQKLDDVSSLKSNAVLNGSKIDIPEWVDPEGMTISLSRGVSPTIVNNPVREITGLENFDLATLAKNVSGIINNDPKALTKLIADPRLIWSKEYTDSEVVEALTRIYMNKYNTSTEQARKEIASSYKDINKERDTWAYTTQNTLNALAELTGELILPFPVAAKAVDKVTEAPRLLAKSEKVMKFLEKANLDKITKLKPFAERSHKIQRFLEGTNSIGGKTIPYFDELYGGIGYNATRNALASFGTQLVWHGSDIDEATQSAENMFVLELLNGTFALAGIRGYKFLNTIGKGFKGLGKTRTGAEFLLKYKKKLNAIHTFATFPAQGLSTAIMNPDADTKQFASEMFMNLVMSGNNVIMNRRLAKDIKGYQDHINPMIEKANGWAEKSPNRKIETLTPEQYEQRKKEESGKDIVATFQDQEHITDNKAPNSIVKVYSEVKQGFYDYAKQRSNKTEGESLTVKDFDNLVKENSDESLHNILESLIEKAGNVKIEKADNVKGNTPAYYDRKAKTIYINNDIRNAVDDVSLTRAIIHEGTHALTDEAYLHDADFKKEIDDLVNELLQHPQFETLKSELKDSDDAIDRKALSDIEYASQSPEEMITFMFDPGMKEGRNAINKISFQENNRGFVRRFTDKVMSLFRKDKNEANNEYISRFKDILESYDYNVVESVVPQTITSEENLIPNKIEETSVNRLSEIEEDYTKVLKQVELKNDINYERELNQIAIEELFDRGIIESPESQVFLNPNGMLKENFGKVESIIDLRRFKDDPYISKLLENIKLQEPAKREEPDIDIDEYIKRQDRTDNNLSDNKLLLSLKFDEENDNIQEKVEKVKEKVKPVPDIDVAKSLEIATEKKPAKKKKVPNPFLDDNDYLLEEAENKLNSYKKEAENIEDVVDGITIPDEVKSKEEKKIEDLFNDLNEETDNDFLRMSALQDDVFKEIEIPDLENIYNQARKNVGLLSKSREQLLSEYRAEYSDIPNPIQFTDYIKQETENLLSTNYDNYEDFISYIGEEALKNIEENETANTDVQFKSQIVGFSSREKMIEELGGKPYSEIKETISKNLFKKYTAPSQRDLVEKVSAKVSNILAQTRNATTLSLDFSSGLPAVYETTASYFGQDKRIDASQNKLHYLDNFVSNLSELNLPYKSDKVSTLLGKLKSDNLQKIVGVYTKKGLDKSIPTEHLTIETARHLLKNDIYLIPRGSREDVALRLKGISALVNKANHSKAIEYGRDISKFSFYHWLDSDSQWLGSREGVYKGRQLSTLADNLNFDKMIEKYVEKNNVPITDLLIAPVKDMNSLAEDIELLGNKLREYYTDSVGDTFVPEYYDLLRVTETKEKDVAQMLVNSITDLISWGVDTGGSSRNTQIINNKATQRKSPWKYHSSLFSNSPLFLTDDYAKTFLPDMLNENKEWDNNKLSDNGLHIDKNGNLATKTIIVNPLYMEKNPLLLNYFREMAQDGGTQSLNHRTFGAISKLMNVNQDNIGLIKPKWHSVDNNGNMTIFKTGYFDYGKRDKYTDKYRSELNDLLDEFKKSASILTFTTSVKGVSSRRFKEEPLAHTNNPDAKALFDGQGNIVDVIVKKDGQIKSDIDLLGKEIKHVQDNFAKGIVDKRFITEMPLTGDNAVSFIETSHPSKSKNAGAFGVNQVPMASPLFPLFKEDGGKGWQAIEELENTTIANASNKIKNIGLIRTALENVTKVFEHKAIGNHTLADKIKNKTFSERNLTNMGGVIKDLINDLKNNTANVDSDYQMPGLTHSQTISMLESTIDTKGRLIPQEIYKLMLAGNLFVSSLKFAKAGSGTALTFKIKDWINDAIKTRGYGTTLTLAPDMDSRSSVARLYEPLIEKANEDKDTEKANFLTEQYTTFLANNIDKYGKLKPYSNGVVLGYDVIKKFGLEPGQKIFLKLTPADDLHTIVPATVIGQSNKPGMMTYNTEYLTEVIGRDFDKDAMQILLQDDKFISKQAYNDLIDLYEDNKENTVLSMRQGKYKINENPYSSFEKELKNGQYSVLGNNFEYHNPTVSPQSRNIYNQIQDMHTDVGTMIARRNILTNAIRNIDWNLVNENGKTEYQVDIPFKNGNESYTYKLKYDVATPESAYEFAQRMNYIIQKMVDKYDFMPINPLEAIYDEMLVGKDDGFGNFLEVKDMTSEEKKQYREDIDKVFKHYGEISANKYKYLNNLTELNKKGRLLHSKGLNSKINKMVKDLKFEATNKPEINKYKLHIALSNKIRKDIADNIKVMKRKAPEELKEFLFPYQAPTLDMPTKKNLPHLLGSMFAKYSELYLTKDASAENKENILSQDFFPLIGKENFNAFRNPEKNGWKEILIGSILYDIFQNNSVKRNEYIDKKVFGDIVFRSKGSTGYLAQLGRTPDGKLDPNQILNYTKFTDIFNHKGELQAKWIPGNVLTSKWLRQDLINRETIPNVSEKTRTIGRITGNLSKYIASKTGLDEGDIFTSLVFNTIDNSTGKDVKGYDVNKQIRQTPTRKLYVDRLVDWITNSTEQTRTKKRNEIVQKNDAKSLKNFDDKLDNIYKKAYQLERNELKYDPLDLVSGAKEVGVTPKINGIDYIDYMNEFASEQGKTVFGEKTGITNAETLNMPALEWVDNKLDFKTPNSFLSSLRKTAKKQGLITENLVGLSSENYEKLYEDIIKPNLKTIFEKRIKDKKLTPELQEQLKSHLNEYLYTYSPFVLSTALDDLNRRTNKREGLLDNNGNPILDKKGQKIMSTLEFQNETFYLSQMVLLAKALKNQFVNKKGGRKSSLRLLRSRIPLRMINDFTNPAYKTTYDGDHLISKMIKTKNGYAVETDNNDNYFKVSDMIDNATNTSLAGNSVPMALVEYILPRNHIESISEMAEVNIDNYLNRNDLNNNISLLPETISTLINEPEIYSAIQNAEIETAFNGLTKSKEPTVSVKTKRKVFDDKEQEKFITETISSPLNEHLDTVVDTIIDNIVKKETRRRKEESLEKGEEFDEVGDIENQTNRKNELVSLKNAIRTGLILKSMAKETADNVSSIEATLRNILETKGERLDKVSKREIDVQIDNLRKTVEDLNGGISIEKHNSNVFKDNFIKPNLFKMIRGLGAINFENKSSIDKINEIFYEPSQRTIQKYSYLYDKLNEGLDTPDYLLSPETSPEMYEKLEAQDKMPYFEYMNSFLLNVATPEEMIAGEYKKNTRKKFIGVAIKRLKELDNYYAEKKAKIKELQSGEKVEIKTKSDEDIIDEAVNTWEKVSKLGIRRYSINERLYELGNKLKLPGYHIRLKEARPIDVFKKGYMLREEMRKQYEQKLTALANEDQVMMSNREFVDKPFKVSGIDIDLSDFMLAAKPELKEDKEFFNYSINNFKQRIKEINSNAIGSLENVFKTLYLKEMPNDNPVAQHLVLGELGKITGNKVVFNKHYGKENLDKINDIEIGTDGYIRYTDVRGETQTNYGRILGTRTIPIQYVDDLTGKPRIFNKDFVFLSDEKGDNNKLIVIDKESINDIVTGQAFSNKLSTKNKIDRTIKRVYRRNADKLLDELVEPLSKTSLYAKSNGRKEADEFLENPDINQRLEFHDLQKAKELYGNTMEIVQEAVDKSFGNKMKKGQNLIRDFVIADSYLGLRYLGEMGLGAGALGLGVAMLNTPLIAAGGGLATKSAVKYAQRLGRLVTSNAFGVAGWVSRNPNGKKIFVGNALEFAKSLMTSAERKIGEGGTTSEALSEKELMKLRSNPGNTRVKEVLEDTVFAGENLRSKKFKESVREARLAKRYNEEINDIHKAYKDWKKKTEIKGAKEVKEAFVESIAKKYKGQNIDIVNDIVHINGKNASHYQKQEIALMTLVNHLLSGKGKMVDFEVNSHANATRTIRKNLREYYDNFNREADAFAPDNEIFMQNLAENLLHKSIGAYARSEHQNDFMIRMAELYSRFSHTAKVDQTTDLIERYRIFKAIHNEIKKDKEFAKFKKFLQVTKSIPFNKYKINDPRREVMVNVMYGLMKYGLVALAGTMGNDLDRWLDKGSQFFGSTFVYAEAIDLLGSIVALGLEEEGHSHNTELNDIAFGFSKNLGGLTGYGVTTPAQSLAMGVEALWYGAYYDGLSRKDRKHLEKYYDKFITEDVGRSVGNLVPIPGANTVLRKGGKLINEYKDKQKQLNKER